MELRNYTLEEMKDQIKKNEHKKTVTYCGNCGKKAAAANPFCNSTCKEAYFEYTKVQVSQKFLKRIYTNCSREGMEEEIKKFCSFHQYNIDAAKKRLRDEAIRCGYEKVSVA